jgi:hypothetical protein
MSTDALRQMIDERTARRDKLRSQIDALELEIRVLQEAAARINGAALSMPEMRPRRPARGESRDRALKAEWALALQFIGQSGTASLNDIMSWSDAEGAGIKRNTLRSQLSIYAERGWVKRVADGVYRLTDDGAAKCGFVTEARNDEADLVRTQAGLSSDGDDPVRDPAPTA